MPAFRITAMNFSASLRVLKQNGVFVSLTRFTAVRISLQYEARYALTAATVARVFRSARTRYTPVCSPRRGYTLPQCGQTAGLSNTVNSRRQLLSVHLFFVTVSSLCMFDRPIPFRIRASPYIHALPEYSVNREISLSREWLVPASYPGLRQNLYRTDYLQIIPPFRNLFIRYSESYSLLMGCLRDVLPFGFHHRLLSLYLHFCSSRQTAAFAYRRHTGAPPPVPFSVYSRTAGVCFCGRKFRTFSGRHFCDTASCRQFCLLPHLHRCEKAPQCGYPRTLYSDCRASKHRVCFDHRVDPEQDPTIEPFDIPVPSGIRPSPYIHALHGYSVIRDTG